MLKCKWSPFYHGRNIKKKGLKSPFFKPNEKDYFSFNCALTPKIPKVGAHNPTKTPTCLADAAFSYPGTFKKSNTAIRIERIIKRYHEFEFIFPSVS
jgi:hypothetical protein